MTATDSRPGTSIERPPDCAPFGGEPVRRVVDVDGIPISALLAAAPAPRGVIVALHGGATSSTYFDCPGHPRNSLIRTASALGYTVIAIDRPGYGSSHPHADKIVTDTQRVDLAFGAVDQLLQSRSRGAGVFLMAHSVGCELALRMAADDRGRDLLGLELSGTGIEHQPDASAVLAPAQLGTSPNAVRDLIWNPAHLYSPELFGGAGIGAPGPRYEYDVVKNWPRQNFPALAARVRAPVHFTAGDYEGVWRNDSEALADIAGLFTASARVVTARQSDGGHNLSVGNTAIAYHLRVLAFAEECVVAR